MSQGISFTNSSTLISQASFRFQIWLPEFWFSFGWPFELPRLAQLSLAVSLGALGLEYGGMLWVWVYWVMFGPKGGHAYGRGIGKSERNKSEVKPSRTLKINGIPVQSAEDLESGGGEDAQQAPPFDPVEHE